MEEWKAQQTPNIALHKCFQSRFMLCLSNSLCKTLGITSPSLCPSQSASQGRQWFLLVHETQSQWSRETCCAMQGIFTLCSCIQKLKGDFFQALGSQSNHRCKSLTMTPTTDWVLYLSWHREKIWASLQSFLPSGPPQLQTSGTWH